MELEKHAVRARGTAQLEPRESLAAPVARYLFGPAPSGSGAAEAALAEIRRRGGVVAPADIMRVTGLRRPDAEALLCKLAARHGGDVGVVGEAVLYDFPGLAGRVRPATVPIWDRTRTLDAVTGNEPLVDFLLLTANLLVLVNSGLGILRTLGTSAWAPALALLPFLAALFALSLPLSRLTARRARRQEVAAENGRRALLRVILERTPGAALGAHALSHVWIAGSGAAIGPQRLANELRALGGEPDVDDHSRLQFRFPDLDHEARALAALRLD
jgi:hypothetical protein